MATLFYDHLINWQKLSRALDALDLEAEDRAEIWEHSEHVVHTEVLIVIVSHLPTEKHDEFIGLFHAAPHHPAHLDFLRTHGEGSVDAAIRTRSDEVIDEILTELLVD